MLGNSFSLLLHQMNDVVATASDQGGVVVVII